MRRAALLVLALWAAPAFADPPGSRPGRAWAAPAAGPVSVPVGRLGVVEFRADSDGAGFEVCGGNVEAFREYHPDPKVIRVRVLGHEPGRACVVFADVGAGGAVEMERVDLIITGDGDPGDPAADPDETFVRDLLAAYEAAPDADAVIGLSTVYRASAADVAAGKASTAGELLALMKAKAEALGLADAVPAVQQVVSVRLTRLLGADPSDAPNAALPADTAKVLNEIADVLRELTNE